MPPLKVEYAKSGRSKCSLKACSAVIVKHEVRIGTGMVLPFVEDSDALQFKWRHVCCFSDQQLKNSRSSGDLDKIDGYNDLAPADKALIEEMKKGTLVGKKSVVGRVGDVANAPAFSAALGKRVPAKKTSKKHKKESDDENESDSANSNQPTAGEKRKRQPPSKKAKPASGFVDNHDDGLGDTAGRGSSMPTLSNGCDDDLWECDTVEYDVVVVDQAYEKPQCPHGRTCYRTNPQHFRDYSHGEQSTAGMDEIAGSSTPVRMPVIKKCATIAVDSESKMGDSLVSGADSGAQRPLCPNGSMCFRKDPVHFKAFRH